MLVGDGVGSVLGDGLGTSVGEGVGTSVGDGVGSPVGEGLGTSVGDGLGTLVGEGVGTSVGDGVGSPVGDGDGTSVGDGVGTLVGKAETKHLIGSLSKSSNTVDAVSAYDQFFLSSVCSPGGNNHVLLSVMLITSLLSSVMKVHTSSKNASFPSFVL
jgi:hypothetical protein